MNGSGNDLLFLVDHMVIKLGKYLRIAGYDAEWDLKLRTHELILKANRENRIFVTRNMRLKSQYPPVNRLIVLKNTDPAEQLTVLASRLDLDLRRAMFSRCIKCNLQLAPVADKESIRLKVHPNVFKRHDRFFTCPSCQTVFWHGSHVTNTRTKLGL